MTKKPGARKQYEDRQAVRLLLPIELIEYIDSVTTNRTQWLITAAQEKKERETMEKTYHDYEYDVLFIEHLDGEEAANEYRADYPEFAAREAQEIVARKQAKVEAVAEMALKDAREPETIKIIEGREEIGSVHEIDGHQYRVTESFYISPNQSADLEDANDGPPSGTYSRSVLIVEGER